MCSHQTQVEKLVDEKSELEARIEELEKELEQRKYHQGLIPRPFWNRMPSLWFSITESEFKVAGVTDDYTKYNYLVSQLDEETTEKVKDIISNPPVRNKYVKLKEELNKRLGEPEHKRMRQLFDEKLKDRTPSQFYRHLQCLAGANITVDKILLHLWLRRLPKHCQEILASRLEQTNTKLAELADNIMEATKASETSNAHDTVVDNIQQSVDELGKQVVALEVTVKRQQSRSRSRSTSKPRSVNTPAKTPAELCWYHTHWGSEAYRCVPPCSWKKEEPTKD
uniref:DUF7041 domain-containing protein n=1 Tax=Heliothis virescens TaxID=7102 RepID=A0A2A4JHF4_HELVI